MRLAAAESGSETRAVWHRRRQLMLTRRLQRHALASVSASVKCQTRPLGVAASRVSVPSTPPVLSGGSRRGLRGRHAGLGCPTDRRLSTPPMLPTLIPPILRRPFVSLHVNRIARHSVRIPPTLVTIVSAQRYTYSYPAGFICPLRILLLRLTP